MESFNTDGLNVQYEQHFLTLPAADRMFENLMECNFRTITFNMFGRNVTPRRRVLAYGDPGTIYRFSGVSVPAEPWPKSLIDLKEEVENSVGAHFNYALLNLYPDGMAKIGHHKDDERSLDPDVPICVVSLGATRIMEFQREGAQPFLMPLHHGSLMVMKRPTNEVFTHSIIAEDGIHDPRISVSFRQLRAPQVKRSEDVLLPDEADWLDGMLTQIANERRFSIGLNMFVAVGIFKSETKIHIRKYKPEGDYEFIPTREGLTMTAETWYHFTKILPHFNVRYRRASSVANNKLLVINNGNMHLQSLVCKDDRFELKDTFITLNEDQMKSLQDQCDKITEFILETVITEELPLKMCKMLNDNPSAIQDDMIQVMIHNAVEDNLSTRMRTVYECNGCIINHPSQRQHSCMTESDRDIYRSLGDYVLLLVDCYDIAIHLRNNGYCFKKTIEHVKNLDIVEFQRLLYPC